VTPHRKITGNELENELTFTTSRSSGPGGQNVNKVNSKVTLKFDIRASNILNEEEKVVLLKKLKSKITSDGVLILSSQDKRTQLQNKEAVISKLETLLNKAFEKKKKRKATKPTKGAIQERLNKKKQQADKKKWRQKPI
jgi:ribosome-associated protein